MSTSSKPFGTWPSPITPDLCLTATVGLSEAQISPGGKFVGWNESRPAEKGRSAIVVQQIGGGSKAEEVLPDQKWNARSRVHEYGGGSWTFGSDGESIVFSDFKGGAYRVSRNGGSWGEPEQITPKSDVLRFADFQSHPSDPSLVLAVLEDHTKPDPAEVVNKVVLISKSADGTPSMSTVASGNDFYASPRFSPSGEFISFHTWIHPDMPWDGSEVYVVKTNLSNGKLDLENPVQGKPVKVAGQPGAKEAVSQPKWAITPRGEKEMLVFSDDRSNWQQLYKYRVESDGIEPLLSELMEEDVTPPDWTFGNSNHAALSDKQWISTASGGKLRIVNIEDGSSTLLQTRFVSISALQVISPNQVAVIAGPAESPAVVSVLTLPSSSSANGEVKEETLKISSPAKVDPAYISIGKRISFPTRDGSTGHAIFYPPTSKDYAQGEDGELPPLVTYIHGGPTSASGPSLSWTTQWWTSRGFAFCAVNYGGSTGHGSEYRRRLVGTWGVIDVQDTISCVEYLRDEKKIDEKRVAITGGSAGGYTVLASLCDSKVFTAGCSYYGVSDLKALAEDTHKFESQYLFNLLGGTPQEVPQNYSERSPLNKAAQITAPLLLLQGSEDKIVPESQAVLMLEKIRSNPKAGKCDIIIFPGEGHGFRSWDAKKRAMEAELEWYRDTWSIEGGKN
ncbi:alpha/beta hydrolase family protein [Sporobolomyces salmoneus]|uniref:alpha/beta hydrolase family protein n=1 Tax=Sporobolomyces salmoneus TaxID=183962 RepID=UPI00317210E8